jgi:hypothetical protein
VPNIIACPKCAMQLRVPDTFAAGSQVKCPKCNMAFAVPAAADPRQGQFSAAPPAQPQAAAAPMGGNQGPGFEQQPRDPLKRDSGLEGLSNEYALDLGAIFNRAHHRFSEVVGPMIGYGAILLAIFLTLGIATIPLGCIPILGDLLRYVIFAATVDPLIAGFALVFLAHFAGGLGRSPISSAAFNSSCQSSSIICWLTW